MRRPLVGLALALLLLPACEYKPSALGDWRDDPSCGRYENRNEPVSAEQERANRCLLDAFDEGRPAELVATHHGEDGGPITTYFRMLGPHRVEVFVDSTADVESPPAAMGAHGLRRRGGRPARRERRSSRVPDDLGRRGRQPGCFVTEG